MRQAVLFATLAILSITASDGAVQARTATDREQPVRTIAPAAGATDNPASVARGTGLNALSVTDTALLYSATFDAGGNCSAQGWTSVDLSGQTGDYWHVDDYAGLPFGPLQGSKSLWCGTRPDGGYLLCGYLTLPGYGNGWNQSWCTKACLSTAGGSTANLDVSFSMRFDSEPSYDWTAIEYTSDCAGNVGWTDIDGGSPVYPGGWSGQADIQINNSYVVSGSTVKVRLHFMSDSAWSDQDGFYPTNGAVHIDNLKVENLALEDFEDESVGSTSSNDWESCNTSYGDVAVLMKGSDVLQEDPCQTNVSCLWAFIKNSSANYACGGHPEQKVVPYENIRNQYVADEIWSPMIPLSGSGNVLNLQFSVYRDSPLNTLVFYIWHARTLVNGCPTAWKDRNMVYNAEDKQWFTQTEEAGALVDFTNATHVQFALGVLDMCPFWCGIFGTGQCHSHSPLIDNVKVYRVNGNGPQWSVRSIDLFQDTFASDGTITGKGRADTAIDIRPSSLPTFAPGDSGVVLALVDPAYAAGTTTNTSGLSNDPSISTFIGRHKTKKQVYMWVAVWPQGQPNKSGDGLSEGPGGQANRYPHTAGKDYVDAHGVTWTAIRADYTYTGNAATPGLGTGTEPLISNRFNVDLNDNLFTPGDTVCYFFGATSPGGTTYYSDQWHMTDNIAEVAANSMEFTILPAGGFNRGGDILYVDGADGYGSQPYFEGAFMVLGLQKRIDRYDVRSPASGVSNTLAGRVTNIAAQLNACYSGIIWDCGSLSTTLGDGTGDPIKCDDYALLNTFMANATHSQFGVYLSGDDVAERLTASASSSAATFKTEYIPFNLASSDHIAAGLGVSPKVVHWPGRAFSDDFFVFGGCPELNDFDVLNSTGTSRVEMSYGSTQSASGAVVSDQTVNGNGTTVTVMLSGFSFAAIRDDETNGISDRAKFLRDMMIMTMGSLGQVTTAGPGLHNSLAQNYPNPFNPQTSIGFSLKARGHVELSIYDVSGRLVRTLANETRAAGAYELTWDGHDGRGQAVASGVYFYRLVVADFTQTKKMVLLK